MIDGLKLSLKGSEIISRLEKAIALQEKIIGDIGSFDSAGRFSSKSGIQLGESYILKVQTANLEKAKLTFIKNHIDSEATYLLAWGDVHALGFSFFDSPKPVEKEFKREDSTNPFGNKLDYDVDKGELSIKREVSFDTLKEKE